MAKMVQSVITEKDAVTKIFDLYRTMYSIDAHLALQIITCENCITAPYVIRI